MEVGWTSSCCLIHSFVEWAKSVRNHLIEGSLYRELYRRWLSREESLLKLIHSTCKMPQAADRQFHVHHTFWGLLDQMIPFHQKKKNVLRPKYSKNLYQINAVGFIIFTTKWAKFHISVTFDTEVTLFGHVICPSADLHCHCQAILWINDKHKSANSGYRGAKKLKFGLSDSGDGGEYDSVGFWWGYQMYWFAMHGKFFNGI